jgi:hypothetical protein
MSADLATVVGVKHFPDKHEDQQGYLSRTEYHEYLEYENEIFVGKRKAKLLRKLDVKVTLPLTVRAPRAIFRAVDIVNIPKQLANQLSPTSSSQLMYLVAFVDRSNSQRARTSQKEVCQLILLSIGSRECSIIRTGGGSEHHVTTV